LERNRGAGKKISQVWRITQSKILEKLAKKYCSREGVSTIIVGLWKEDIVE